MAKIRINKAIKEGILSMDNKAKRKVINSAIYIGLALIITAIMCITIITFVSANKRKKPPVTTNPPSTTAPRVVTTASDEEETTTREPEQTAIATETEDNQQTGNKPEEFTLPTAGYVMREYSIDVPVYSPTMDDYRTHAGIDISAAVGSPVYAVAAGVVVDITDDPFWGKTITIEHGEGLVSIYKNLAATLPSGIAKGVKVSNGQVIGAVGDTCLLELADSDHLHFEMKHKGSYVDPLNYLKFKNNNNKDEPGDE